MIASVEVCLPNWTVRHLTVWSEIVDSKAPMSEECTDVDLEAAEEATQAARFQEIRSKVAFLILYYHRFFGFEV